MARLTAIIEIDRKWGFSVIANKVREPKRTATQPTPFRPGSLGALLFP